MKQTKDKTITELVIELEQSKRRLDDLKAGRRDEEIAAKVAEIWTPEKREQMQKETENALAVIFASLETI